MVSQENYDVRKLRIDDITIIDAKISNKSELLNLPKNEYQYSIGHSFEIATSSEGNKIRLIHTCDIETIDNKTEQKVDITGKFDIAYFFYLENFNEVFDEQPQIIANNISTSLINICYSTSRGIMYTRCQGTIMKNVMLPILPTEEIANFHKEPIPKTRELP